MSGTLDLVWENSKGLTIRETIRTLPGRYHSYYEGIYQAIVAGTPSPVSAEQALDVIAIIECARQSSNEQRTLPFPQH